jgi:poly(A) polymerase
MPTPALFFGKLDALETALALSRYPLWKPDSRTLPIQPDFTGIASIEQQRTFLSCMLLSPRPDCGLEYLKASGLIAKLWPELASLDDVEHSKDFHPEGNGWKHTLAMFQYRKRNGPRYNGNAQSKGLEHNGNTHGVTGDNTHNTAAQNNDLILSLGLLLHDTGKPLSSSAGSHRFEQHAELGATVARRFLDRLGFAPDVADSVCFLVRNHMFPAALPRLPLANYQKIVGSPLFPVLMELYRCDESSSFKGLDRYYEASAAYQAYLRKKRQ